MSATKPAIGNFVAWFPLHEAGGNNRVDLIGGYSLTELGSPTRRAGHVGNYAAEFSGSNQALYAATASWNEFGGSDDVTFGFWFYGDDKTNVSYLQEWDYEWGAFGGKALEDDDKEYAFFHTSGGRVGVAGGYDYAAGDHLFEAKESSALGALNEGNWQFYLGGYDQSNSDFFYKVYNTSGNLVEGETVSDDGTGFTAGDAIHFMIGGLPGNTAPGCKCDFDGAIEQFFIYEGLFTGDEISWLVNGGAGQQYWDLFPKGAPIFF